MTKKCTKCGEEKTLDGFTKDSKSPDGLQWWCRSCFKENDKKYREKNSERIKEYNGEYYKKNRESVREQQSKYSKEYTKKNAGRIREYWLKKNFGLDPSDFNRMFAEQDGRCKICKKPETRETGGKVHSLSVDHCHVTGVVRGLLCHRCNVSLGGFYDDPELLEQAAVYLRRTP